MVLRPAYKVLESLSPYSNRHDNIVVIKNNRSICQSNIPGARLLLLCHAARSRCIRSIRFNSSKVLARRVGLVDCRKSRTRGIKGSSKVLAPFDSGSRARRVS
jgi:hypothetical protein